jgi:hypothetical protein
MFVHSLNIYLLFSRAIVGELDDEIDSRLDLGSIKAEPLNAVTH